MYVIYVGAEVRYLRSTCKYFGGHIS